MLALIGCGGAGSKFASHVGRHTGLKAIIINEHAGDIVVDKKRVEAYATVDKKLINMAFPWLGRINSPYIFVLAGLGGNLGTNLVRIIGRARKRSKLIGLFTLPFSSENRTRREMAQNALEDIERYYDMYFVLDNDGLVNYYSNIPITAAMSIPTEVMKHIVLDFKNMLIKNILSVPLSGKLGIGIGFGAGKNRMEVAIEDALDSPWINDGKRIMLFSGDIELEDAKIASRNYEPIFVDVHRTMEYGDEVKVTIITVP